MTDRAKELLERAMESLDGGFLYRLELKEKIRAYLAEPTPDEEPVGTLDHNGNFKLLRMVGIPISQPMKLYEHPAPRPDFVRLSEEEVSEILSSAYTPYEAVCATENRLVEKNK